MLRGIWGEGQSQDSHGYGLIHLNQIFRATSDVYQADRIWRAAP